MRLGELLVGGGLLTTDQLEQALRAQVMWGGRLGTNLIELGFVELDHLARALAQQHRMPAALGKHFERVDRELQQLLSADVAEKFSCVPLARVGTERAIVLATTGPLTPRALAIVADELVVEPELILPSVAAELRIRYHLERVYGIPRDARFLRSRGKTIPPFPTFANTPETWGDVSEVEVPIPVGLAVKPSPVDPLREARAAEIAAATGALDELELEPEQPDEALAVEPPPVRAAPPAEGIEKLEELEELADLADDLHAIEDLDDLAIPDEPAAATGSAPVRATAPDAPAPSDGRDRRRYLPTLADAAPAPVVPETSLGRIPIRRVAVTAAPPQGVVEPSAAAATLAEATRAIRRASGRDRVAELVMDTLQRFAPGCEGALFLVLRNEVAIGWKGFVNGSDGVVGLGQIAVPIDQPGVVPGVVQQNCLARRAADDLSPIDARLHAVLGGAVDDDLVVVPVTIAGQVMCMIATTTAPGAGLDVLESVAAAAAAAFSRLMRDAAR